MNAIERFTDAALDVADTYDNVGLARGIAESVLEELLPEVREVEFLMALPAGSVLLSCKGTAWVRLVRQTHPWGSVDSGGFGSSTGDVREITERFVKHEAPFRLVWVP